MLADGYGPRNASGRAEVDMMALKTLAAALALAVSATTFSPPAKAGGEELAAGIIGFSAGVIAGGALAGPRYYAPGYYYPRAYYPRAYPRAYYPRAYYPRRAVAPHWRRCHRPYVSHDRPIC
jgi:hypothetical protein